MSITPLPFKLQEACNSEQRSELVDPPLVNSCTADSVVLEAEHADGGRNSEFNLVTVSQLQEQEPPFCLSSSFISDSYNLKKPENLASIEAGPNKLSDFFRFPDS